jgi:hypothetical protein
VGLAALGNPAHVVFALGVLVTLVGVGLALTDRWPARPAASRVPLAARLGLALTVAGSVGFLLSAGQRAPAADRAAELHAAYGDGALQTSSPSKDLHAQGVRNNHGAGALLHLNAADLVVTSDQQAASDRLLADTRRNLAGFSSIETARARGYVELAAGSSQLGPLLELLNPSFVRGSQLVDPTRPDGLIYLQTASAPILIGALFLAPAGDGPRLGGGLTIWAPRENVCLDGEFIAVAAVNEADGCPAGSDPLAEAPEELRVWRFDHPDGPFASHFNDLALTTALRQLS